MVPLKSYGTSVLVAELKFKKLGRQVLEVEMEFFLSAPPDPRHRMGFAMSGVASHPFSRCQVAEDLGMQLVLPGDGDIDMSRSKNSGTPNDPMTQWQFESTSSTRIF